MTRTLSPPPDCAPLCPLVTQEFGCTDYAREWYAPDRCPELHYFHAGIDLSTVGGSCGDLVAAPVPGRIRHVGLPNRSALGPYAVCLDIAAGVSLLYGHLAWATVAAGQVVQAHQAVGHVGSLGASTACHLHFEVRTTASVDSGQLAGVLDPAPYLYTPAPPPAPPEEPVLILAQRDDTNPDPHGPGAVYLVLNCQAMPGGAFVLGGPKRHIADPGALAPYQAAGLTIQKVNSFQLDRCEDGPVIAAGSYPSEP